MAQRKRPARTTSKRLTRGPRKGKIITVYVKGGTEVKRGTKGAQKRFMTSSHSALGSKRIGKNTFRTKRGGLIHRVGRGAASRFAPGAGPKKSKQRKMKSPSRRRRG